VLAVRRQLLGHPLKSIGRVRRWSRHVLSGPRHVHRLVCAFHPVPPSYTSRPARAMARGGPEVRSVQLSSDLTARYDARPVPLGTERLSYSPRVPSDRGLLRVIGRRRLTAAIVNVTIGAGIFLLPAMVAGVLGPAAPLA